ncbi:MAG: dienelactone hydrolase family protein [Dehalococcoidia bacterium]|nr:dienelactone hydrolase family protein [Dehalococcoidia bacterium]MCA9849755.1 dienelactone hydrolase family protein [Dehalococcoidia bacterium]MCA9855679.1 dienelactone hydrolase family protein [Dehalococcoidia bacterium]
MSAPPTTTRRVEIPRPGGKPLHAHLAVPAESPAPAVVVVHEIYGLNKHIRDVCQRSQRRAMRRWP